MSLDTNQHEVPPDAYDMVDQHLDEIESEYDIGVALAVAHGSHAWGSLIRIATTT